ncbi:MAG: signal recognition particle receptor subunit alpha, partial [Gordonia sp. (in: high G+C Gram-positive bacteria)]
MNTQVLIGIIIAVVLVLALAVGAGVVLRRRRQISLHDEPSITDDGARQVDKSGGYQAGTGFSFSQGGTATLDREPTPSSADEPAADQAHAGKHEAGRHEAPAPAVDAGTPGKHEAVEPAPEIAAPEAAEAPEATEVAEAAAPEAPEAPAAEPLAETADSVETAAPEAPTRAQLDDIAPPEGRLSRLRGRLARSQGAIGGSMLGLLGAGDLDEDSWEEIEDTLVMADLGTAATTAVVDDLRAELATGKVRTAEQARAALRSVLVKHLHPELDRSVRALPHADGPAVVLVAGVNGVGKTTTTGKLARVLVADGRRVLLGAADTFRAAAADQLQTWGERVGAG